MNKPLKIKIIESGKSQIEIAGELGIYTSLLSNIVNGWVVPKPETQEKLATLLNCRVEDIF